MRLPSLALACLGLCAAAFGQAPDLRASMPAPDTCDAQAMRADLELLDTALAEEGCLRGVEEHILSLYALADPPAMRAWRTRLEELRAPLAELEAASAPGRWLLAVYGAALTQLDGAVEALAVEAEAGRPMVEAWDAVAVAGQRLARFDLGYLTLVDWALADETRYDD